MSIARIVCAVTLHVEVFDQLDNAAVRVAQEATRLTQATKNAQGQSVAVPLDVSKGLLGQEYRVDFPRPFFILQDIRPMKFSLKRNSFRKADELDIEIPLSLLPVPASGIRAVICHARIAHVSDDAWVSYPQLRVSDAEPSFVGICVDVSETMGRDSIAMAKLKFHDYVGMLAARHVDVGKELDEEQPISQAVQAFLVGTWAEGIECVWVDPKHAEPTFGKYKPTLNKKRGKKAKKAVPPKDNHLDAIFHACADVGCIPVTRGARIEFGFAGTIFAGQDRATSTAPAIIVGQIVESIELKHEIVGKPKPVQVVSYDPDKHAQYTARWPPDPKSIKAQEVTKGQPPRLPPLSANMVLPGREQLDESVSIIPVAPVRDPALLPQLAQMLFLERARQRVKVTVKTHSPWTNPTNPTDVSGDILQLVAGDNVRFGFLAQDRSELLPPEVRALSGTLPEGALSKLLQNNRIPKDKADAIAAAVASMPAVELMRVDEIDVSGGGESPPEITLTLVSFTVLESDLDAAGNGVPPAEIVKQAEDAVPSLVGLETKAMVDAHFAGLRSQVDDSLDPGSPDWLKTHTALDDVEKRVNRMR